MRGKSGRMQVLPGGSLLAHAVALAWAHAPLESLRARLGTSEALWDLAARAGKVALTLLVALVLLRLVPSLERLIIRVADRHSGGAEESRASTIPEGRQRLETLTRVVGSFARALIWAVTVVMILGTVGVQIAPLLAGAGIAGVAVGFGAQSIVKDFFAGFFILLENQFDVGDSVTISGVTGKVERMTMRITVLRDETGTAYFIPNSGVGLVANRTDGWSRAAMDVQFAMTVPDADVREALTAAANRANENLDSKRLLVEPAFIEGPLELGAAGVTWRVVARARPDRAAEARRALISAVRAELEARRLSYSGGAWSKPAAPS